MPVAMEINQEPDCGPRSVREDSSLLVLALLAFAVGGTSGLLVRSRLSAGPRAVRSLPGRGHRLGARQGDYWLRARGARAEV